MYESPLIRAQREALSSAVEDTEFAERLLEAIKTDPDVRAAILRLVRTPPQPPPRKTTQARKGRGR